MIDIFTCILVDDELFAIELLSEQLSHLYKNLRIDAICTDWESALNKMRERDFDLLFMDVSMPGKNGINLLKLMPSISGEIIFITAHEEFAIDAFKFNTAGYLLKPVSDIDLSHAVDRALSRVKNRLIANNNITPNINDKIGVPNNYGIDYLSISDILYVVSENKCTKIVTPTKTYISFNPLIKFRILIDSYKFMQVHRSYIVNLNAILRYESSGLIIMSNKHEIPLARTYKNDFLGRINLKL